MLEHGSVYSEATDQPQVAPDASPAPAELVTVRINGQSYTVTPEVADALQNREQDFNRRMAAQGSELGQLRAQVQTLAAPAPQQRVSDDTDPDLDYFRSPHQTVQQQLQRARQEIIQEVTSAYQQERNREQFWNSFYGQHPELKQHSWIVDATLNAEWSTLGTLPPQDAAAALAQATRARIAGLQGGSTTRTPAPQGAASTVRSSAPTTPAPAVMAPEDESYGLADVIAARRRARQEASLRINRKG